MLMQAKPNTVADRIQALRKHMLTHEVDALLIPSADPHLSEYLPARWQGRQWFSGFTGSMGTLLIGQQKADRKSTRLNSSHVSESRMPSSA